MTILQTEFKASYLTQTTNNFSSLYFRFTQIFCEIVVHIRFETAHFATAGVFNTVCKSCKHKSNH